MFNYMEFYPTAFPTEGPQWTTENKIIYVSSCLLLRCFSEGDGISTVIFPPNSGHSSHVADFDKNKSIVETVLKTRQGPVYCVEWISATPERKNESIEDLIRQVDVVLGLTGPSHLIGLCQGGWLSAMYAALYPDNVKSLTCVASPIDFHIGGGHIYNTISKLGMEPYRDRVEQNGGLMKGKDMLLGWKLMNAFDRFVCDYVSIWSAATFGNRKRLASVRKFRTWYEYTQDLPGNWYLWICENGFLNNLLITGRLEIGGRKVDLFNIDCPVVMIAGEKDDITLPEQVFALGDYTCSTTQYKVTIPDCGHIGAFMGGRSQKYIADTVKWIDNQ